ncbi:MAG: hypothetical protein WC384_06270 [Prolixibacteraceae bacterium]|jgi:hypothetical protein
MKKIRTTVLFLSMILFFIGINYNRNTLKKVDGPNLTAMIYLNSAQAEGGASCSYDCGGGTSVSLTCDYECRASSSSKGVRCYDVNGNIVEESFC